MKLSKLKLKNYRCFGSEEQVILIDQLTTFIGNNSAGKTAALSALIVCFLKTVIIVFYIEVIFICQKIYFQMKWNSKVFI